ncbi:hypothetical protein RYX36_035704 [Vicia faba]
MDSSNSTPRHHHHRSSERRTTPRISPLSRIGEITATEPLRISLDLDQSPTAAKKPSSSPSPLSLLRSPTRCFPLRELLLILFSAISELAILFLAVSFISNSICQRDPEVKQRSYAKLKEDDILRLAKLILPALNFAILKTKGLFSGEPSMTLKVAPFLLLGARYGHLITIWRLSAIGFFVSFSVPKLYSCYFVQINQRAECLKLRLLDTWSACSYKKIVVVSALITFWNLSSTKTRICTGFLLVVIFRYIQQNVLQKVEDGEAYAADKEQRQVSLVAEPVDEKPHQARLVAAA